MSDTSKISFDNPPVKGDLIKDLSDYYLVVSVEKGERNHITRKESIFVSFIRLRNNRRLRFFIFEDMPVGWDLTIVQRAT